MKLTIITAIRLLALTIIHFVVFAAVSAAVLPAPSPQPDAAQAGETLFALLAVSVVATIVFSFVVLRSRWAGWKLVGAIFLVYYGVMTVMPQIETAFFVTGLPAGMLPRLFLSGAIIAAIFSVLAVLVLGKRKPPPGELHESRSDWTGREWVARLSLIVIAYLALYFTFGYYIAWQSPAVRAYYGGVDPGSFVAQLKSVIRETPLLVPLQIVRAIMWTLIALPVIRMIKGRWWEAGLAVSLLFSVVMTSQLLLPNPLMPRDVRMVHLVETATSNFLFGWLVVYLLRNSRQD